VKVLTSRPRSSSTHELSQIRDDTRAGVTALLLVSWYSLAAIPWQAGLFGSESEILRSHDVIWPQWLPGAPPGSSSHNP